jgi:hypothetical protein
MSKLLGSGTCWCGVYPIKERVEGLRKVLDVASVPFSLIAVGVPDEVCMARGFSLISIYKTAAITPLHCG